MRRIKLVLALAAVMAAMLTATAAPAMASSFNDDRSDDDRGDVFGPHGLFDDFGDNNDIERENVDVFCPVMGNIVDNASALNSSCPSVVIV